MTMQGIDISSWQAGDTLSVVASKLGVSASQISGYHSGNPNLIYPGQVLKI